MSRHLTTEVIDFQFILTNYPDDTARTEYNLLQYKKYIPEKEIHFISNLRT